MVNIPSNRLDHNIASSHALYTYLAISVRKCIHHGRRHLSVMLRILPQLLDHMELSDRTLQLGEVTIEVGRDGQTKNLRACFAGLPEQLSKAPPLSFTACIIVAVCAC